jgi:hypothetical protein
LVPVAYRSRSFGVASEVKGLLDDCKKLAMNRLYLVNVLGYITFNFVLGAYAYWGPKAGQAIYSMVWHLQSPIGFYREQQFLCPYSLLLLLLMVDFGAKLESLQK